MLPKVTATLEKFKIIITDTNWPIFVKLALKYRIGTKSFW